jgi:hypothetical protein
VSQPIEVSPGVVCIQPPCPTCLGECGKWIPIVEPGYDPEVDEDPELYWEPCLLCDATGLMPIPGWPPPIEWCQPVSTAPSMGRVKRWIYSKLPWGPE